MTRRKLTIVVTCTDRKATVPRDALTVRTLGHGKPEERVQEWRERLRRADGTTPLADLYRGETWTQVKRLVVTARNNGYCPDVLVASAGLGLRRVDERAPAYAATFSSGHADTVAPGVKESQRWWAGLPQTASPDPSAPAVWVLSEAYARVVAPALAPARPESTLVFGGFSGISTDVRIAADRALRRALGGTLTSINVRMAIRWLELAGRNELTDPKVWTAWKNWSDQERFAEQYDRQAVSDETLRRLISTLTAEDATVTKTRALRTLREGGVACEQRRFSALFEEVRQR